MPKKTLEKAMENLEKIVMRLETEQFSEEEYLWLYSKGVRLAKFCDQELTKKEQELERRKAEILNELV